jgi:hypothetical protein
MKTKKISKTKNLVVICTAQACGRLLYASIYGSLKLPEREARSPFFKDTFEKQCKLVKI